MQGPVRDAASGDSAVVTFLYPRAPCFDPGPDPWAGRPEAVARVAARDVAGELFAMDECCSEFPFEMLVVPNRRPCCPG